MVARRVSGRISSQGGGTASAGRCPLCRAAAAAAAAAGSVGSCPLHYSCLRKLLRDQGRREADPRQLLFCSTPQVLQLAPPGSRQGTMESRQGRRPVPASLPHKLEALQRCGRAGPLFTAVPHSGLTPIEDVVDAAGDLKSERACEEMQGFGQGPFARCRNADCRTPRPSALPPPHPLGVVLLGFTRDGAHLVSYTTQPVAATDGQEGYCLQLWSFTPGARCRRLWSAPLFRCVAADLHAGCMPGIPLSSLFLPAPTWPLLPCAAPSRTWTPWRMRRSSWRPTTCW